ncbi:MAG: hypothetical protein JO007_01405 [Alphaproteobacteria bacterium]|nr:hypothetical protein [Alphaproteobacteria bacterium]
MADIETSVAITAQTDGLQSGLSSAADAVESATAAMRAQFADLGAAAQQAQAQIGTAAAQIGSAIDALHTQTADLASVSRTGLSGDRIGTDTQYPGISVTDQTGATDIAQLKDARDSQWAIDQEYYEKKATAAENDVQNQQGLLEQQEIAYQNYLNAKDKLDAQAVQNSEAHWQSMLQPIQRALDRSITGIITGTTTVQKALSDVSRSIVGEFVNSAVGGVLGSVGNLFGASVLAGGGRSGNQDFSGGVAGAAEGILGGGLFSSLFKGIGTLFSFEQGGIVPSAQGGWMVPSTSLAMLHTNEMVLPANISQGLQSMIANGGGSAAPNVTFAISAMDAQSVAAFFKNNGATLVSAINNAIRNGSALRSM